MKRPVFIAASPNTEQDDVALAKSLFWNRKSWSDWKEVEDFEQQFGEFHSGQAVGFDSARSSLFALLAVYGIGANAEVILPAFSCMVVANAVIWAGAKPIYADCNTKDFNYDLEDLKRKLSKQTKVIVVQHSFGFAEDIRKIREIVGPKVIIIEDLAHALGAVAYGRRLGSQGDAAIATFGIEKVISGVRGGMAIVHDEQLATKLKIFQAGLPAFPKSKTMISLWNPIFWEAILPIYYFGFGKLTLGRLLVWGAHFFGLFGNMIEAKEYRGEKPNWLPSKPSPALFALAANQFTKLDRFITHRRLVAELYTKELGLDSVEHLGSNPSYLRYPLLVIDRNKILHEAKQQKIILGDWYKTILYAPKAALPVLGYLQGSCPNAEFCSDHIINLPTYIHIKRSKVLLISSLVKPYLLKTQP